MAQWVLEWHRSPDKASLCVRVGSPKERGEAEDDPMMDLDGGDTKEGFSEGVSTERAEADQEETSGEKETKGEKLDAVVRVRSGSPLDALPDLSSTSANDTTTRASEGLLVEPEDKEVNAALEAMEDQRSAERMTEEDADPLQLSRNVPTTVKKEEKMDVDDPDGEGEFDDADGEVEMFDILDAKEEKELPPPELPIEDILAKSPQDTSGLRLGALDTTLSAPRPSSLRKLPDLPSNPPITEEAFKAISSTVRTTLQDANLSSLTLDMSTIFDPATFGDHTTDYSLALLSDLFGEVTPYALPVPLDENAIMAGKLDRRIDDATTSSGKLAHTSRLLDVRPVLISTLEPAIKRKGDGWADMNDLWGSEDIRDLGEMRGDVYSSGTSKLFSSDPSMWEKIFLSLTGFSIYLNSVVRRKES